MVTNKLQLLYPQQVVNLYRSEVVNLNRPGMVNLNRPQVVNFIGFCSPCKATNFAFDFLASPDSHRDSSTFSD